MPIPVTIKDLSTTAASNSPAGSDSIGNPGQIDDYFRAYGSIQRAESLNKSWERWNDTPTYISATQFSVATDLTSRYVVNRRVKCTVTAGTVYGYISVSAFSSVTTVTVVLDSGALDAGLSEVQLAPETYALGPGVTGGGNRVFSASPTLTGTTTQSGTPAAAPIGVMTGSSSTTNLLNDFGYIDLRNMDSTLNNYAGISWSNTSGNLAAYVQGVFTTHGISPRADIVFSARNASAFGERMRITSDGRLYGTALHNNANPVTGTANQYIASGRHAPTETAVTNIGSTSSANSTWVRTGNVVSVGFEAICTPSAAGATELGLSLPIASNLASLGDLNGTASAGAGTGTLVSISEDTVNKRAKLSWTAPGGGSSIVIRGGYQYEIL